MADWEFYDHHDDVNYRPAPVPAPLPHEMGYDLDTIEKARTWLTHPQNWFRSTLFVLRWDGLVPSVSEHHGRRLLAEPWDNGLPQVVVMMQRKKRMGTKDPEETETEDDATQEE